MYNVHVLHIYIGNSKLDDVARRVLQNNKQVSVSKVEIDRNPLECTFVEN